MSRLILLVGLASVALLDASTAQPPPAKQPPAAKGNLYVLSVGVEPQLTSKGKFDIYAQDAEFVASAMSAGKPLFGKVEPAVVNGKNATRNNVLAALKKLKTQVREQDTAVIFFSTHGGIETPGGYTITLANGPQGGGQWITGAELLSEISALPGKVVVMLDTCCAAGAIPAQPTKNIAYITACRKEESSFGQSDRRTSPHGYFVIAVCEAMTGMADQNGDGAITIGEIQSYVTKRATALCGEQHAVSRIPPTHADVVLGQVDKDQKLPTLFKIEGRRNPFGFPDIDRPLGKDVQAFAMQTRVPGAGDDENAQAWNRRGLGGKADTIAGQWEYRWKGGTARDAWVTGVAQIRLANDRVFILCRDSGTKYMIEGQLGKNERIVGRYVNLNDSGDTSPFVGRLVTKERIDGYWSDGRWDLRRKLTEN